MIELRAADGHRFEVHPKFWATALYCAEEYGKWRPRFNVAKGEFTRDGNSEHLGEKLMKLNPVEYEDLASFLMNHPRIKIIQTPQSCGK